jgi:hypothetical protein
MRGMGVALNGFCEANNGLKTTKLASGGILVLVFGDVNGSVQEGYAPVVGAIASGGASLPREK